MYTGLQLPILFRQKRINMFSNFTSQKNNYFSLENVQFQIPKLTKWKTYIKYSL